MKKQKATKDDSKYFKGNPKVKAANVVTDFTDEEIIEIYKCSTDFIYFCVNYIKITDQDAAKTIPFELYEYQKNLAKVYDENNRIIVMAPRQSGKSIFTIAYLLWYMIFNEYKTIVLVANKEKTAKKTLKKWKEMYFNLPFFMKQGVEEWNKMQVSFDNNSTIYAESTSSSGNRGDTVSILYIDECAIIEPGLWEDFYASVYPTIASVKTAKIIISSTPKGYNFFHQLWTMASNKQSEYIPFRVFWNEVPGRDEAYKIKTIAALGGGAKGLRKWRQEYECFFAGSGGSLIEGDILEKLIFKTILESRLDDHFLIYEYPEEDSKYITISDVGEGVGADSSTTQVLKVVDLQKKKFRQVACYRDNTIKTNEFDLIVHNLSAYYNNALAICENNSYGREILNRLVYDNDYENVFFEGEGKDYGMKMTTQSKKMGCSYLKKYIEDTTIELVDFETISELSKYIKKGNSYQADTGAHDDLVTPLVLFSYFISKKENVENWLGSELDDGKNQMQQRIADELLPMGFICNGHADINLNEAIEDDEDDFDNEEEIFIRSVEIRS